MFFIFSVMSCCNEKRLDGLQPTAGADLSGDVAIGGDLTVESGHIIVEPARDGWANIRSSDDAFGLDIEAPAGKKIRLLNGGKSWVEVDETGLEIKAPLSGQVGVKAPNVATDYDFVLPIDMGVPTQVLTSDGTNTYWSTPAGPGGGGTVTSVDMQSLNPFLSVGGGPITGAGVFGIDLSGVPLDVLHGGTGVSTSTGTGSVVLNTNPDIQGSLEAVTDVTPSGDAPWKFINLTDDNVDGIDFAIYKPNVPDGGTVRLVVGKSQTFGLGIQYVYPDRAEFRFLGVNPSLVLGLPGISASNPDSGTLVVEGGLGVNLNLQVGRNIVVGGDVDIRGANSGSVDIRAMPDAGTWAFNLPLDAGSPGQVLTSQGGGTNVPMTWSNVGTVTSVGMVVPSFLNVSGGPITSSGVFILDYSGVALPVGAGGTGTTTSTGTGSVVLNTDPVFVNSIGINGTTSGRVTITVRPVAGTWNFNLPNNAGTTGQVLTSQGGGTNAMVWANAASGTVTSVGMTVPSFLNVSGSPVTTSGVLTVGYSGTPLPVANGGTGTTTSTGTGSVVLNNNPSFFNQFGINGATSGRVSFLTLADTGTWNFYLPTSAGSVGQVLTSQGGSAAMIWTTPSTASGTVTSVGMTVPAFLQVAGSPVTTSGVLSVGLSGVALPVTSGGTGVTSSTGSGSNVLNTNPVFSNSIGISGTSSGTVSITARPTAGTWNFNLPITAGTAGQVLTSQGGVANAMTWSNAATGTVTSVGITSGNAFLSASGTVTTTGNLSVGLSGSVLPTAYGGTGTSSATGSGANVLQSSPTLVTPTISGNMVLNGNLQSTAVSQGASFFNITGGSDIIRFYKTDLTSGNTCSVYFGCATNTNLAGVLVFKRDDGGNGSRVEINITGGGAGCAIYKAFVNGANWYEKTMVVDGGIGCSGNIKANNVAVAGNFIVDEGGGGLETHTGDVFRYTKGSGNMELECIGHVISNLLSSQKWTRMGNMVYVYFDATFDIDAGTESELVWTNLPAIPLGIACSPMGLQTNLEPSAIMIVKKYVVEADPVIGARFYRVGASANVYQSYVNAQSNVRISGMLTYPADETF